MRFLHSTQIFYSNRTIRYIRIKNLIVLMIMQNHSNFGEESLPLEWKVKSGKRGAFLIKLIFIYGIGMMALLLVAINEPNTNPNDKAIILMGFWGLWVCWIGVTGTLMYKNRDKIKRKINMLPQKWMAKFVVFAVVLLLLEEMFTTSMTNLYWLFGGEYGKAFITASDNYFEVVLLHSAIVLWPAYLFWAWWLKKYDFHPNWVFLIYGCTGLFSEISYGGFQQITALGMWIPVYGLMIYLPAFCVPENRGAKRPKLIHYLLPFILQVVFQLPFVLAVSAFRTAVGHPRSC